MHRHAKPPAARQRRVACLEGALAIGSRTVLLAWREIGEPVLQRSWRVLEAGAEVRPPHARLALAAADGAGALQFLMLRQPRSGRLILEPANGADVLAMDLAAAPPLPLGDLARGLPTPDRGRLLGWLLGVCPALFRLGAEPELGFAVRDLLQALLPPVRLGAALRRCHVPGGWTLLETAVGEGFQGPRLAAFVLARQGGLRPVIMPPAAHDPSAAGRYSVLAAFEDHSPRAPATLILIGSRGITCRRIEAAHGRLAAAADWIAEASNCSRSLIREAALNALALLAERQSSSPAYGALMREVLRTAPAPRPAFPERLRGTLTAVAVADRRILAIGTLGDPDHMVAGLRLRRLGATDVELGRADLLLGAPGGDRGERTFLATVATRAPGNARLPWRGYLVLGSGRELAVGEAPLLDAADEPLERLLDAAAPLADLPEAWALLEPVARDMVAARLASHGGWQTRLLGPPLLRPRASLLVPFRRAEEAGRLVAMLDAEPEAGTVELVLVGLDPGPGVGLEAAVLAARHAKAIRLVVPSAPLAPADAPWLGIAATEAPIILSVGLGVVPRVRGWLGVLLAALSVPAEAEARLALAGLPLAGRPEPGPLPSLAVLAGVRRDDLLRAGGLAGDWLDAEHRDADLALRLLAAGSRARMLAGPCCVRTGPEEASRAAGAARLAAALDTRQLARRAAEYRQRRAGAVAGTTRPERLAVAG